MQKDSAGDKTQRVGNWSQSIREGGFRLNLMQCGDGPNHSRVEAGAAAADILLSSWKQNLNWGMVYLTSKEQNKETKETNSPRHNNIHRGHSYDKNPK